MRVLVLGTYLTRRHAGTSHATLTVIRGLLARHSVAVYAWDVDPGVIPDGASLFLGHPPPSRRLLWRWPSLTILHDLVRDLQRQALPTVDVCYTSSTSLALAFRQLWPDVPIISHTGAMLPDREYAEETSGSAIETWVERKLINRLERMAYAGSKWDHLVSTTLVARERGRHYGLPDGFFTVRPLPVDSFRFPGPGMPSTLRSDLAVPSGVPVISCVARLVPLKQIDLLLRAVAACPASPWLIVAGEGQERSRLENLASELGIAGRCRFLGQVEPGPVLAASDFFVLPSRLESFGLAYAEAMTMGLPAIGLSNRWRGVLSAAEDIIPYGEVGYCVGSVAELQGSIDRLATDAALRRVMGAKARSWALSHFAEDRYITELEAIVAARSKARSAPGPRGDSRGKGPGNA